MSGLSYFVYYRVTPAAPAALKERIAGVFEAVAQKTGILGRLLVRRDDPLLWMEVYEAVGDGAAFEAALHAAVTAFDIASFMPPDEARHVECFTALPDQAAEPS